MTIQSIAGYLNLCSHERVVETLLPMTPEQFEGFVNAFDPPLHHPLRARCWEEIAREALRRLSYERGQTAELERQIESIENHVTFGATQ
jgi:hypothetical protein